MCLVRGLWVPVSAGRRPHPLTPSSWRGTGGAGPRWGRPLEHRGSTGRSRSASGPTTSQQLPRGGDLDWAGPPRVTWPLRPSSAQRQNPPLTREQDHHQSESPSPGLSDRGAARRHRRSGQQQAAQVLRGRGVGAVAQQGSVELEGEGKSPVWRQDSLALVNPLSTPALGLITALSGLLLDPLNTSPGQRQVTRCDVDRGFTKCFLGEPAICPLGHSLGSKSYVS